MGSWMAPRVVFENKGFLLHNDLGLPKKTLKLLGFLGNLIHIWGRNLVAGLP